MVPGADDKKYATDTRSYRDACLQDGIFDAFTDSPVSSGLTIKDVCIYKPGDLNKVGKEGRTSWDSFSYALLMGHNVWTHTKLDTRFLVLRIAGQLPIRVGQQFHEGMVKDSVISHLNYHIHFILKKYSLTLSR